MTPTQAVAILLLTGCGNAQIIAAHMERCTLQHLGACYMQAAAEHCLIVEIQQ